jgi:hypothetical protein
MPRQELMVVHVPHVVCLLFMVQAPILTVVLVGGTKANAKEGRRRMDLKSIFSVAFVYCDGFKERSYGGHAAAE